MQTFKLLGKFNTEKTEDKHTTRVMFGIHSSVCTYMSKDVSRKGSDNSDVFTPRRGVTLTDFITERLPGKLPPQVRRVLLSFGSGF